MPFSAGDGENQIEIIVAAQDKASEIVSNIRQGVTGIGVAAKTAQTQMLALSDATRRLGTIGLGGVLQLKGALGEIRGALASPIGATLFDQVKSQAEEALGEIQPLSAALKELGSVGSTAATGFFNIQGKDVLNGLDQRFASASAKFSNGLINGIVRAAPALDNLIAPLDQKLAEVVVDGVISSKIPGPLNSIADKFGVNLSGAVSGALANTPLKNFLGGAAGQALGGSLIGAAQAQLTSSLTGGFAKAFVSVNSTVTENAFSIGQNIGANLGRGVTEEAKTGFEALDETLDGVLSNFIDKRMPQIGEGVAKALDVKGATRNFVGETTNAVVGGALAGNAAGLVGGALAGSTGSIAASAGTQVLKLDVAAGEGLKALTGGALVELGGQLADVTKLTDAAEAKFANLFTTIASNAVKRVAGNLVNDLFGTIDAAIPGEIKFAFSLAERFFPQQIEALKTKSKDAFKGFFGQFTETPVERLQSQIDNLTPDANRPAITAQEAQAIPDQLERFEAAEKAKAQIAGLKDELFNLKAEPAKLKAVLDQVNLDASIDPAKKAVFAKRLTEQIEAAEAALKSPAERIKEEILQLEQVASSFDFSTIQAIDPQQVQQVAAALNDIGDVDRAKAEIADYERQIEDLKNAPKELNDQLREISLNPNIKDADKTELAKVYTAQIDEAQDALIEKTPELKQRIADLQAFISENYATAQSQTQDDLFAQTLDQRTANATPNTTPIDVDAFEKADAARQRLALLRTELEAIEKRPSELKEELVKVELDTNLDPQDRDRLVNNLTSQISAAEAALENPVDRLQNQIKALQNITAQAPANFDPAQAQADLENFQNVDAARQQVAQLQAELDALRQKPIELQAELQRVNLDDSLSDDEKGALTKRLTDELADAERAIKAPVDRLSDQIVGIFTGGPGSSTITPTNTVFAKVAGQIVNVSGLAERAKNSIDSVLQSFGSSFEEVSTSQDARLEKQIQDLRSGLNTANTPTPTSQPPAANTQPTTATVDTTQAEQQIQELEAQLQAIRDRPLEIQKQIVQIDLDPDISEEDKAELIAGLVNELNAAQGALQVPLENLANTINNALGAEAIKFDASGILLDLDTVVTQVDSFFENVFSDSLVEIGTNAGTSFAKGIGSGIAAQIAPVIDQVDSFILGTVEKLKAIPEKLTQPIDAVSNGAFGIAGLGEPTELFNAIQSGAGQAFSAIASVGEQITFFSSGLDTLRSVIANGPFELLIGQNIKLREQILSTQASLVSTNKVVDGFTGGAEVKSKTNPDDNAANLKAQFDAVEGPIKRAIDDIRKGSLELSGVTSGQLIDTFNIIATQAGSIGLSLKQSSDLTLSMAAAFSTLGVPLEQARQEINSILQGQITSDSVVGKSLGITNEQVRLYKQQGNLFEKLTERLQAFRVGNQKASETVSGYTSNIQEAFEMIAIKAGEPLLDPIVKELALIYKYLNQNQEAITKNVSGIAQNLFKGVLTAYNAIKFLASNAQELLSEIPTYLFDSLANFLVQLGNAIMTTAKILEPVLSVLGQLASVVQPLSGPVLQLALQFKVMSVAIGGLASTFGFLSKVLPGVGELMFGINVRTLPLINMFPTLAASVGQGAAGFLLLAKHMNDIPGVAGIVQNALGGVLGPLGPLVAGFVPQIAGIGITVLGVAKNFPFLQGKIDQLFAAKPDALLRGLAGLTSTVPGLSMFSGLIEQGADRIAVMAKGASLAEFATAKFQEAVKLAAIQLRNFVVSAGLLAAGLYLAFVAFDQFILKNQALMETLKNIGEGITQTLGVLGQLATSPAFVGLLVSIGATVVATTNLHLALLRVVGTQLASWAAGAAGAMANLAKFSSLAGLGGIAAGAARASVGLQALQIALTQGSVASAQFLAANGQSVITLGLLRTQLMTSVASFKVFITSTVASAFAVGRTFVTSLVSAGVAMARNLIAAIPSAIAGLLAMRGSATGASFSFAALATSIRATGAAMIGGVISAGKAVIGFLIAAATGAGGASIAFATLATAVWTAVAGFLALAAPIALVVAAIAAVGAGVQAFRISESTKQVEAFGKESEKSFGQAIGLARQLKTAKEQQADRTKNGIKLTQEEYAANQKLQQQATQQIATLDTQIAKLEEAKKKAVGDANKGNLESQIAQLNKAKSTLSTLSTDIKIAPKDLPEVGSAFQQLADKAKTAEEAIKNAAGDPEIFKTKVGEIIDITDQQLKQGQISAEEARRRLSLVANNSKVEAESQLKAQEAITETYKVESQEQVEAKQAAQEKIQADVATGKVSELAGEKQLTELKNQELNAQLEASKSTLEKKLALLDQEQAATREKLAKELADREKALAATKPESRENKDAAKAVGDAQQKIADTEAAFADRRKNVSEQLGNEQTKLQAQIDKNTAESATKIREAELKSLEDSQKKAQNVVKSAANDRLIQQQQLAKQGLAGEADIALAKVEAAKKAADLELEAEKEKIAKLQELAKTAPTEKAKKDIEKQLAESRLKSQDLTLKSLETEQQAYDAHINKIKSGIEKQQTAEEVALQKRLNTGDVAQPEIETERAKNTVERLDKEVQLETRNKDKRLKLELELEKAKTALREAGLNEKKAQLEREATMEEVALQRSLNAGKADTGDLEQAKADRKVANLEKELALETTNKDRRLKLELELEQAKTSAREAGIAAKKQDLEKEADLEELALQRKFAAGQADSGDLEETRAARKVANLEQEIALETVNKEKKVKLEIELEQARQSLRQASIAARKQDIEDEANAQELALQQQITAGEAGKAEVDKLRANSKVQQLAEELALETTDKSKRLKLGIELEEAKRSAAEAGVNERKALLEREATQEQIVLQRQINAGTKRREEADLIGKQLKVKQLQEELNLAATDKDKRLQLELQLEQAKGELIDAEAAKRKAKLDEANKAYQNQIEAQNQGLQRQSQLYEMLDKALENRNRLFKAAQDLSKAGTDFAVGELEVLSQGEKSEVRKRQLAEITAAIKLEGLKKQQEFERQSLALDEQKNKLALEREIIANRIAQSQQQASIASAKAELEIANADPKTTKAQRDALQLKLQAEVDKGVGLTQQGGLLQQQGAINEQIAAADRQKQGFQQRLQLRQAQGELAQNLPPGLRGAAQRNLQQQIAQDFGVENYQDLRRQGLVKSRTLAAGNFGFTREAIPEGQALKTPGADLVGVLGAMDEQLQTQVKPLLGLQQLANPSTTTQLLPTPVATAPTVPQALPLPTGEFTTLGVSIDTSGKLFASSVDRLIKAMEAKPSGQTFQITVTNAAGQSSSTTTTSKGTGEITVEDVVKQMKQLVLR